MRRRVDAGDAVEGDADGLAPEGLLLFAAPRLVQEVRERHLEHVGHLARIVCPPDLAAACQNQSFQLSGILLGMTVVKIAVECQLLRAGYKEK